MNTFSLNPSPLCSWKFFTWLPIHLLFISILWSLLELPEKHMDAIIKKGIVGITGSKTPIIPNIKKKKPMLINKDLLKQLTLVPAFCLLFAQWALGISYNSSSNYLSLDFSSAVPPQDNSCNFEVVAFEYLSLSY